MPRHTSTSQQGILTRHRPLWHPGALRRWVKVTAVKVTAALGLAALGLLASAAPAQRWPQNDVEQLAALEPHFDWALNEECFSRTSDRGRSGSAPPQHADRL